jgi:hypothetical protein
VKEAAIRIPDGGFFRLSGNMHIAATPDAGRAWLQDSAVMRMRALNTGTIKTSATQIWAGPKTESRESVVFFRQRRACEGISASMKKMMLLGALFLCAAAVGHAQESRMDVSASLIGVYAPDVYGQNVFPMHTTNTGGVLASYRYMLTPRSALELNYSWAQNSLNYHAVSAGIPNGRVHARQQELSGAYVYSRTFKNYNPFLEAGVGAMLFRQSWITEPMSFR